MPTTQAKDKRKNELKVTVFAPRAPKPKKFKWRADMTVGAAAAEAAEAFGYASGSHTLARDGVALDRETGLADAGIRDGDELELVDIGGGV